MLRASSDARAAWLPTDGWVLGVSAVALGAHLCNTAWRAVEVVYAASLVPLVILTVCARRDATLRWALGFGTMTALLWAVVEGVWARIFGWWGTYDAAGPRLWDTPLYCLLVGAQASTHVTYIALRSLEFRISRRLVAGLTGLHALGLATLGENLLVAAGMWSYRPWGSMWGAVPAFVVASYATGYVAVPTLRGLTPARAAALFSVLTFVISVLFSLAVQFQGIAASIAR